MEGEERGRTCSKCGEFSDEGFVIGDNEEFYCCESCLLSAYSWGEYEEMYEKDEAFWTHWWGTV